MNDVTRARRAEIDRKNKLNPFPAGDIRPRRAMTPYAGQRPPSNVRGRA